MCLFARRRSEKLVAPLTSAWALLYLAGSWLDLGGCAVLACCRVAVLLVHVDLACYQSHPVRSADRRCRPQEQSRGRQWPACQTASHPPQAPGAQRGKGVRCPSLGVFTAGSLRTRAGVQCYCGRPHSRQNSAASRCTDNPPR
jgi:hypothetical protein